MAHYSVGVPIKGPSFCPLIVRLPKSAPIYDPILRFAVSDVYLGLEVWSRDFGG